MTFASARFRKAPAILALGAVAAVAFVLSVGMGAVALSPLAVLRSLAGLILGREAGPEQIIVGLRLTRALLAAAVGASLASSGAVLQGLFRNPLADPFVIGSSSGASLGAVLAMTLGLGSGAFGFTAIGGAAFLGGLGASVLVYAMAGSSRIRSDAASLLLAGSVLSSLLSACVSMLLAIKDKDLHQVWFWLLGGFSGRGLPQLAAAAPAMIVGFLAAVGSGRVLDVLSAGDDEAASLGLSPVKARLVVGAFAALSVSAAVSVAGSIGFVGLVSPHIARRFVGPSHGALIPASALVGAAMLTLADTAARSFFAPIEMPVGALTAFIGAPFFLYKLARRGLEATR
ncbi:MAG: iron ABC transporter permease [Spirochaetales bacterium]|nr:iron ABC transporter permease [Spirochaetales bacterium]